MSSFLILYIDESVNFASNTTKKAIISIDNADLSISKNETSEGFIVYKLNDESININIGKDWQFIAIESSGNAALNFATELNKLLGNNLHLTDSNYSFLCKLDEVDSIEGLKNIIIQAIDNFKS